MNPLFNRAYILKYKVFWIIFGVCFFANLAFYASVINRQKLTIADLQQKYTETRQLNTRGLNSKDSFSELKSARRSWQEFIGKLPPVTMVTLGIKDLIRIISRYESSNNKLLFNPKKVDQLELWRYSTEITITDGYENIRKLLAEIQNAPHLFCIDKLSMAKSASEGKVDLTLGITMYSRLNNETAG